MIDIYRLFSRYCRRTRILHNTVQTDIDSLECKEGPMTYMQRDSQFACKMKQSMYEYHHLKIYNVFLKKAQWISISLPDKHNNRKIHMILKVKYYFVCNLNLIWIFFVYKMFNDCLTITVKFVTCVEGNYYMVLTSKYFSF